MRSNDEWREFGVQDPLWGVASWTGKNRGSAQAWTDSAFYALGADWLDFEQHWERYGLAKGKCLEIGCGAGRMTAHLSCSFERVVAIDVSSGMIDYAKARVSGENIDWVLSDGTRLPCGDASIDAVFSCHVFQHFPSIEAGLGYFREISRVLTRGGTFMIQLPLYHFPEIHRSFARFLRHGYRHFLAATRARDEIKRLRMRFGGPPFMRGIAYDQRTLFNALVPMGFSRVEFSAFYLRASRGIDTCVLGTKD